MFAQSCYRAWVTREVTCDVVSGTSTLQSTIVYIPVAGREGDWTGQNSGAGYACTCDVNCGIW